MTKVISFPKVLSLLVISSLIYITAYAAYAKESTGTATTRKEKVEQRVEVRKENISQRIETRKENMATRTAALKEKLKAFKDQKKASAAARISDNLNRINDKQTEQMLKHLEKMSSILLRLEDRVNSAKPDIKDATSAKATIEAAKAKISSSEAAVKTQAEKDYTLTLSSESKARVEAQALRQKLHTDLRVVRQTVIDAKQSVGNAIRVAKSGKIEPRKEGTNSGQQ